MNLNVNHPCKCRDESCALSRIEDKAKTTLISVLGCRVWLLMLLVHYKALPFPWLSCSEARRLLIINSGERQVTSCYNLQSIQFAWPVISAKIFRRKKIHFLFLLGNFCSIFYVDEASGSGSSSSSCQSFFLPFSNADFEINPVSESNYFIALSV